GVAQLEQDNLLVIGPSSGGGGGGGSVDPTTIFQTGDVMWLDVQGPRTGWVRDNGRTVGSAVSGATERANADVAALFSFLWTNYSNTICPVSGGRGASAVADFAANKTITLPDKRGYVPGGLDDMGNSAASRYANVPVVSGDAITAGSVLGEATHTITKAESAVLTYVGVVTDPGHVHAIPLLAKGDQPFSVGVGLVATPDTPSNPATYTGASKSNTTGITVGVTADAGGGAHNTVQKTVLGTFYRKL
ncbi:MAG: hypothetical protein G4V63_28270, partial [Candidatus Afipia apatlaquensis]|nr:hypothetical protein [Candidatus Afipia apatlaquensis]